MEQQRALNALEPYLALSKSANSPRAAADLIAQATSDPHTYIFAELLQTPNIQALRASPDHLPHLRLLEIFSWGSYADYKSSSNLPTLNPQQHRKLQLLSLLPLCTSPETLSYTPLQNALGLPTDSDLALESLITTAIYDSLLSAHLDPLHRTVRVTSVAPLRDPAPDSVTVLLATLKDWENKCQGTLQDIETQIAEIKANAQLKNLKEQQKAERFEFALAELEKNDEAGGGGVEGGGGTRGKKSGGGSGGIGRWAGMLGKGGKRAAPMDNAGGPGGGGSGDVMDVDDKEGAGSKGPSRAAKRKGLGMR